ncbi:hypothetical protein NRB13_14285 [Acinetobacter baumannii]|nr:hypothetical protein [Acinetobacter baumannii]HCV3155826.1 hypothetical protein [Acinetobacter baumannii]
MKASKLIRDKGLQYAKEIVDSAPSNANEWNEGFEFQCGQSVEISKADREKYFVDISELKRLLESIDQINAFDGGIKEAKEILSRINKHGGKYATLFERPALEQAIRDYESIYGGGDV